MVACPCLAQAAVEDSPPLAVAPKTHLVPMPAPRMDPKAVQPLLEAESELESEQARSLEAHSVMVSPRWEPQE